ncbi:hypothetical protein HHI36_016478, partial [Cryptolaemus montrouzieri]
DELGNPAADKDTDDEEENDEPNKIAKLESSDTKQEFNSYGEPEDVCEAGNCAED